MTVYPLLGSSEFVLEVADVGWPIVPGREGGHSVVVVVVELAPDERLLVLGLGVRRRSLVSIGLLGDALCDLDGAVSDLGEGRVQAAHGVVAVRDHICKRLRGAEE